MAAGKKGRRQPMGSCSPQGSTTVLGVGPLHYTPRGFMVCQLFTAQADTILVTLICVLGVQAPLYCLGRGSLGEEHQQRCSQTRDSATKPAGRQQNVAWLQPQTLCRLGIGPGQHSDEQRSCPYPWILLVGQP